VASNFNSPHSRSRILLLSVKATSLGINLTGATRVILFDVSWNPATDSQALHRAYRFPLFNDFSKVSNAKTLTLYRYGQTRPVTVYRFVASETVEERIFARQVQKSALFNEVVDERSMARQFTKEDLGRLVSAGERDRNSGARPSEVVMAETARVRWWCFLVVFSNPMFVGF
jgi:SNF2 family DNA or RNA helicase